MKTILKTLVILGVFVSVSPGFAQTTVSLPGRTINKLLPDYLRPRVYALNQANGSVPGTLLALDATNGNVINEIPVNLNPTDMVMTPAGDAIYVINAGSRTISKVDLTTFSVVAEKSISTPNTYSFSNPLHIAVGRSNLVYFTDGGWAPSITTFDYANGTNVAVYDDGNGTGGLNVTRDGQTLYRWRQYGWGAGNVNSWVTRYDAFTNANLTPLEDSFVSWRRDPTDTPIFFDAAERWVFNKEQMFAATNVSVLLNQFTDNIYGVSLDGSIAFGPTEIFNAQNGATITNLPFSTTVQTLSGDQRKLFRYNSSTTSVVIYDMTSIAPLTGPIVIPTPADGSVVSLPLTNLSWTVSPYALSYDVYFGSSQAAVAAATPASPQYLGRVTSPTIAQLQALTPGATYYWRVDLIGFSSTNSGAVWSFSPATISVNPSQLNISAIAGYNPAAVTLDIASSGSVAWTETVTGPNWLSVSPASGGTPSSVTASFNTSSLSAGQYTNNIEFTASGLKLEVPVTVTIKPLNIVKMAADGQRPYIYALQAPALSGQSGLVLFINTSTGNIDNALPIGINPVDLTINYGEGRLYIASWGEDATYVVDLNSQTLLPPLHLGTDVYKINAGKPGRIMTEGEDQWIGVNLIDTTTGNVLDPMSEREGDGEMDPTGTIYYHCDNNISDAYIHKIQITNDVGTEVAGSNQHPYGSRNLVLSPDGTTLFWQGYVYDANLNELGSLGEQIYATTAHGDLALGSQHVFNSHNGQILYTWPFSATVMAVSGDQQKVFLYNSTSSQIMTIPMSSIATLPGPGLNPTPANGSVINPPLPQVSWTVSPFALSYQVYLGASASAVAAADTNSPLYLGTTTSNSFSLPASVNPGSTYYWRVDSVGFSGVTTGAVWSFTVSSVTVTPQTISLSGVAGLPILPQTISLTAPLAASWNLTVAQPWLSVSASSGVTPSSVTLNFNTTNLAPGIYTNQIAFSANGITLQLPVTVQLFSLNASKMVADPNRDYIYVLHPGSGTLSDAFLLFLNTDTGIVEKVIPIGINPTDMAINRFEDRLYVSNWQHAQTHVVDLKTQTELSPLLLGTDVYKINPGIAGRMITEGEDQWIAVNIVDTATGSVVGSMPYPEREGDGETDPSGTVYYHCDNNISDAHVHKEVIVNDVATEAAASNQHPYGTRNLVLSADGTRLFWNSYMYDTNLVELGPLGAEIYACTTDGSIAFSDHQAFDTTTRLAVYTLPVTSTVKVVDRLNQRLWYFNPATSQIQSLPLSTIRQPSITQQPAANTGVVVNGSVNLTVTAIGISPLSYQWTMFGTNLPGATNYFLSLSGVQPAQQGDYQAIISNPYGSVTSSVAHVTIVVPPVITNQSPSMDVSAGRSFSLSVGATGTAPLTYTWNFENTTIYGANSSTLTINNAQSVNEGAYRVIVANSAGSATSAVMSVRVMPSTPVITANPVSVTVAASSNATFSVTATGSQPFKYQWYFNGSAIPGATASQFTVLGAQSINNGGYYVVVSNGTGFATSTAATLTVNNLAPYFTLNPVRASVNAGTSRTLTGLANGSQPISYQWQHNGLNIPGATSTSLVLTNLAFADSGPYVLIASNIAGVTPSAVAQLNVSQGPAIQQPLTNQVLDAGATATLTVVAGSTPTVGYAWRLNGTPIAGTGATLVITNIQPSQSGYYAVTITNQYGSVSTTARVSVLLPRSSVIAWGDNSGGQTNAPANLNDIVGIAGGDYHSVALHENGTLIAWGYDGDGQTNVPTSALRFVSVAAGAGHNLAITENGGVIAWGRNDYGQINVPSAATNNVLAVAAGDSHSLALLSSGTVVGWGDNSFGQINVPQGLSGVRAIAAGRNDSLALRTNGTVVAWGYNTYGQASPPSNLSNVVAIAAGYLHSAALLANGTVVEWGDNSFGQTNVPANLTNVIAIAAGDFHTYALRADGTVVGWGDDTYQEIDVPPGLTNVIQLASGNYHGLALIPTPTIQANLMSSSKLVLNWSAGVLQWAPTPTGPFTDVGCQGTCYTNTDMNAPMKFFRVRR
ncbi:MAG TPA: immunoglobulin domain-containing protein [Candidatus Angelobacter sp.]|nr:immunoglobulin domain-containing protein [Candidatus Angelobacter sp.]